MLKTLEELIKTIRDRKFSSPDQSYTNKLLNDKNLSLEKMSFDDRDGARTQKPKNANRGRARSPKNDLLQIEMAKNRFCAFEASLAAAGCSRPQPGPTGTLEQPRGSLGEAAAQPWRNQCATSAQRRRK